MSEQFGHLLGGAKIPVLIAGFVGGLVSLSFLKPLTRWQAISAVFTGATFAFYAAPAIAIYLDLGLRMESLVAFLLGLTAMNVVPAILQISQKMAQHADVFINWLNKRGK